MVFRRMHAILPLTCHERLRRKVPNGFGTALMCTSPNSTNNSLFHPITADNDELCCLSVVLRISSGPIAQNLLLKTMYFDMGGPILWKQFSCVFSETTRQWPL
jgi:hypothetical protein